MTGQVETTKKAALAQFCEDWNALGRFPTLHVISLVDEALSRQVALAQSEIAPKGTLSLPENPHSATQMTHWITSHQGNDTDDIDLLPLQVVAVDRRGRIGLLDVDVNVGKGGYRDTMTRIQVHTILSGYRLRNTWMDPAMFAAYHDKKSGKDTSYRGEMAEDRIKLFQKSIQAMIKDIIRDAGESQKKAKKKDIAREELQSLIDYLKEHGINTQALAEARRLSIDTDSLPSHLTYQRDGLSVTLMSNADPHEKNAVMTLIRRFEG